MICTKCKIDKFDVDFGWRNKLKGKKSTCCRSCYAISSHEHYIKNSEKYKNRKSKFEYKIKMANLIKSLKIECFNCGIDHPAVLDFHHVDPTKKDKDLSKFNSIKRILEEAKKCIVLCSNCHRVLHWNNRHNVEII